MGIQKGILALRRKRKYQGWLVEMECMRPVNYVKLIQVTELMEGHLKRGKLQSVYSSLLHKQRTQMEFDPRRRVQLRLNNT